MPSVQENLTTARENFATQLAALSDPDNRKPTYSIGGRTVDWVGYMRFLQEQIKELDTLIAGEDYATTVTAVE